MNSVQQPSLIPSTDRSAYATSATKEAVTFMAPGEPIGFGQSGVGDEDDFRPTTPGSSPGAGHSFEFSIQKAVATKGIGRKTIEDGAPLTGTPLSGSRPAGPGHSPGVGHTVVNENSEPKA